MDKPILDKNISVTDFKDYYWLKKELIKFCKVMGISSYGGKIEISDRIISFLENGKLIINANKEKLKTISNFNWNTEKLEKNTLVTDNYKNTENVRKFFKQNIGNNFKFNVEFMNWMKANNGKTLGDAVNKWKEIVALKKNINYRTGIAPQFEYNNYIRDFIDDNKNLLVKDAINCWKIKRNKSGTKKYEKGDLRYLKF